MITNEDYKIIEARCTYDSNGNHDIEYVVIEYRGKLYIGQSNKSQHEALNNAVKSIDKDKLLELYRDRFSFYNFDEDSDLRQIKALEEEMK